MKKLFLVEVYKLRAHLWILIGAFAFVIFNGIYTAGYVDAKYANALFHYPRVESVLVTVDTARYIALGVMLIVPYIIGMDFASRYIQNIISVGTDKRTYFFAKLLLVMSFATIIYAALFLSYNVSRFWMKGEIGLSLPIGEFLLFYLVMLLQLFAYTAVANMMCMILGDQVYSSLVSVCWILMELILLVFADAYHLNFVFAILDLAPWRVMEAGAERFAIEGTVYSLELLKNALSAAGIFLLSTGIGYICFMRKDQK